MEEHLRRRAAELIKAEARYILPPSVRFFLLGVATGVALCALGTIPGI